MGYGWRKRDRRYIPFPSLEELSGKKEFTRSPLPWEENQKGNNDPDFRYCHRQGELRQSEIKALVLSVDDRVRVVVDDGKGCRQMIGSPYLFECQEHLWLGGAREPLPRAPWPFRLGALCSSNVLASVSESSKSFTHPGLQPCVEKWEGLRM